MYVIKYHEQVMSNQTEREEYYRQLQEHERDRFKPDGSVNEDFAEMEPFVPKYEIVAREYKTYTTKDRDYWLDVIKKTYKDYGLVSLLEASDDDDAPITLLEKIKRLEQQNFETMQALTEVYEMML